MFLPKLQPPIGGQLTKLWFAAGKRIRPGSPRKIDDERAVVTMLGRSDAPVLIARLIP